MSIEFSTVEIERIKTAIIAKGIKLRNRELEFRIRLDIVDGKEVQVPIVHIQTADGFQGPEYEIPQLLQD